MQPTTATRKIAAAASKGRIVVVQGGQGAGKTYSILLLVINHLLWKPGQLFTVVAESVPKLKRGPILDFKKILRSVKRYDAANWNATDKRYTFANGSVLEFVSGDNPDKYRGARRQGLFLNEADSLTFDLFTQMESRTAGPVLIDYNPSAEFWVHTEVVNRDDAAFLILTYLDNEYLPTEERDNIERAREKAETSQYWANWWRVYGLGQIGRVDGLVYKEWTEEDEVRGDYLGTGLDFGFDHAMAVVDVYRTPDGYLLDEVFYGSGHTALDVVPFLEGKDVVADVESTGAVQMLRDHGVSIMPAKKGPGSVLEGINLIAGSGLIVTKQSVNIKKELRSYAWMVDKAGRTVPGRVVKENDDALDAARMVVLRHAKQPRIIW